MIGVFQQRINKIPSLVVVDMLNEDKALPLVTYFHGFTSAKEHNLPLAYLLANQGYRVVLPDSKYHGERETGIAQSKKELAFWDIVINNVEELGDIRAYFDTKELILNNRFGVAGTSMGGITTSATLTQYPWIKSAAILMGSPKITIYAKSLVNNFKETNTLPMSEAEIEDYYTQIKKYDLSKQMDKLQGRPLLLWHGENDAVVPFDHSYTFYKDAISHYKNKNNIRFLKEANRDHKVSRYAILETVKWFEKHL